jgi:hypothetical protein
MSDTPDNPFAAYVTEAELAKLRGVHERTVIRWRERGEGPPFAKIGKTILYRRGAVADWLRSREIQA